MSAVWIALGAVGIALVPVFIALNAGQAKKRKQDSDGGTYDGSGSSNSSDCSADSGGDCGGGD